MNVWASAGLPLNIETRYYAGQMRQVGSLMGPQIKQVLNSVLFLWVSDCF